MEKLYEITKDRFSNQITEMFSKTLNEMKLLDRYDEFYQDVILDEEIKEKLHNILADDYLESDIESLADTIVIRLIDMTILVVTMEHIGLFFNKVKYRVDSIISLKNYIVPKVVKLPKESSNLIKAIEIFVTVYFANNKYFVTLYESNKEFQCIYDSYPEDIKAVISDFRDRKFILNKISNAESTVIKGLMIANPIGLGVFGAAKLFGKKKISPIEFAKYDEFYILLKSIKFLLE